MNKKELIDKIKNETSLVEFYKLKEDIIKEFEGKKDKGDEK